MSSTLVSDLRRLDACREALAWAANYADMHAAWAACDRGDWMLWVAARTGVDRKRVVLAACACARLALVHVPYGELRPLRAIETAEAWCRDEATIQEVRRAAADARAYVKDAVDAARAAYAAAYAARAADADALDADDLYADAAYGAAYAAAAYGPDAARKLTLLECAEICRRMLPVPTLEGA